MAILHNIQVGTTLFKLSDENVASIFLTGTPYTKGDIVLYENDGFLYRFKEDKAAGAWDASKVDKVTIASVLKMLDTAVANLTPNNN